MEMELLRRVGLSNGETNVYSAILDLGPASINQIHEKTGFERRNIYDILNKLIEKGLVNYVIENKRRMFNLSHPNKLIGYIDEKEQKLEKIKKDVLKEMPLLLNKFNSNKSAINAEVYRGPEGIKAVFEDLLNCKENYWIGGGRYIPKKFPNWFINWNKRRIESKVRWINLVRYELKNGITPLKYEKIKFLPKDFSGNPTAIGIYGNKIVNLMLGEDLFAFVIESKDIAENYKKYHKYLWNKVAKY